MAEDSRTATAEFRKRLDQLSANPKEAHDQFVAVTISEAIDSAEEGNFGVGAVLVDRSGNILRKGRNRVFYPYFRSDIHAEMDIITGFESESKKTRGTGDLTLFSSLEPCPMCLTRLIISGVGRVYHAAIDEPGGMVERMQSLPPEWLQLASGREFASAKCSPGLRELALDVFELTVERNDERLLERANGVRDQAKTLA